MQVRKSKIRTQLIYIFIKENRITKEEFCKMCGISLALLNKILDGYENVSALTIFKIAENIGVRYHQMFDDI